MTTMSKSLLAGAAMIALTLAPGAAFANGAKYNFDIPAQGLSQSLLDLSDRTGAPIVADGALVEGEQAPAIRGRMTPAEALKILLAPAGLTYERDRATIYRVIEPQSVVEIPGGASGAQIEKDEIIVTGTNIRTASHIRGAPTDSAPLFTFSQDDIQQSGYRSAEEFIQVQPSSFGGPRSNPFQFAAVPVFDNTNTQIGARTILAEPSLLDNSVSIHGLSALTLVNGRRFLGDLASLPVTAIERVDVLADGASAIYGDGAVPGVVNAVLLDEFDGIRTTARYGFVEDSGAEEYLAGVTAGKVWDSGKAIATYEFLERTDLTFADRGYSSTSSPVFRRGMGAAPVSGFASSLLPGERRHRAHVRAEQSVTSQITLFAEGFASTNQDLVESGNFNNLPTVPSFTVNETTTSQYTTTLGANINLGDGWQSDLTVTRSALRNSFGRESLWLTQAKADGPVFYAPGGAVKLAVGGEFRIEAGDRFFERNVVSGFGETFVPLIGEPNRRAGLERLELSVAGRIDHYEKSGGVLSPRASLLWSPFEGLALRGTYGRSHQRPFFGETNEIVGISLVDSPPPCGVVPPCFSPAIKPVIFYFPGEVDLPAARSENLTAGADYSPAFLGGLTLSATYYDIEFKRQRTAPPTFIDPNLDELFPETNLRIVTQGFADRIAPIVATNAQQFGLPFDDCITTVLTTTLPMFTDIPIYDAGFLRSCVRLSDIVASGDFSGLVRTEQATGRTRTRGLDASIAYETSSPVGDLNFFANANVVFTFQRQVSETAPAIETADTFSNPLDYRLRGGASWRLKGLSAAAIINHADDYTYTLEPGGGFLIVEGQEVVVPVAAATTLDLHFAYNTGESAGAKLLRNLEFSVSAINVTNEVPPALRGLSGFDDFNADPTGRFVAFQVTKTW